MNDARRIAPVAAALCLLLGGCAGSPEPSPGLLGDQAGISPVQHYEMGFNLLVQGDETGAEEAFRASLRVAGRSGLDFAPPHEGMARLHLRRGRLEEAFAEADHAISLDSHWTRAYWVLGKVAEAEGREPLALAHYERALIYDPGDREITEAAADLLKRLGRNDEAQALVARSEALRAGDARGTRGAAAIPPADRTDTASPGGAPAPAAGRLTPAQALLEPFFPASVRDLPPKLLAVFDQPHLTRGALAVLVTGDGEHVLARAFSSSVRPDEEVLRAPQDVSGRPEERWIHQALGLGLMEMLPDGTFRPDEPLTRLTLALWIEETIARLRNRQQVFQLYRGQPSPFTDVPDGHYGLNAARIAAELDLLEPDAGGRFRPGETVGLVDGVEVVRRLAPALMGE